MDLALNNLQWLICHKTKPNQTKADVSIGGVEDYIKTSKERQITVTSNSINVRINRTQKKTRK